MSDFPAFNLHCHTHYSFNANGYSPTDLAQLAKAHGWYAAGIVDFDVLDGVDEFLDACDRLAVRGVASLETRVYVPEFATREINSPGEPGVFYFMGVGFTQCAVAPEAAGTLSAMRRRAEARNRQMIERINTHLVPVAVDYARDVLPLTPAGNATERHLLKAYIQAVEGDGQERIGFWAEKLGLTAEQVAAQVDDYARFSNTVRGRLMKRGGVGYIAPAPGTFPTVEEASHLAVACGALPCATWLDGFSAGEQAEEELLELLIAKGTVAINIIPDRNWNISDPEQRRLKVQKLYEVVALAQRLDLPVIVGTEMNAPGQKLVDDFAAAELLPVRRVFRAGVDFLYGHTLMQRALGLGYQSDWARTHLPARRQRNDFYTHIGRAVPPGAQGRAHLAAIAPDSTPDAVLSHVGEPASVLATAPQSV
ncbi:MAG: PHP domain-containing protein [Chloroflexota bacterium]